MIYLVKASEYAGKNIWHVTSQDVFEQQRQLEAHLSWRGSSACSSILTNKPSAQKANRLLFPNHTDTLAVFAHSYQIEDKHAMCSR